MIRPRQTCSQRESARSEEGMLANSRQTGEVEFAVWIGEFCRVWIVR